LGEGHGKLTGQRVLDMVGPKIESSFTMNGAEEGKDHRSERTVMKQGALLVMQEEGQGIITTKDGEGMATWTGHGIGRFTT